MGWQGRGNNQYPKRSQSKKDEGFDVNAKQQSAGRCGDFFFKKNKRRKTASAATETLAKRAQTREQEREVRENVSLIGSRCAAVTAYETRERGSLNIVKSNVDGSQQGKD